MTDTEIQHRLPRYRADLFADRRAAIKVVVDAVAALHSAAAEQRIISFRGGRGLGKSWLAFHLARTIAPQYFPANVLCLLIGLGEAYIDRTIDGPSADHREWLLETHRAAEQAADPSSTLQALLTWFAARIGASVAPDTTLSQLAAWITHRLKQPGFGEHKQYQGLVCIVDSVYEADPQLRLALEQYLLDDLAQNERALLVFTGRGNKPDWNSFYIRRDEHAISLGSLQEAAEEQPAAELRTDSASAQGPPAEQPQAQQPGETKQKIAMALAEILGKKVEPAKLDQLLEETEWLPLNTILAKLAEDELISWEQALDELLRFVEQAQRPLVRSAIVALSILEGFRQSEMRMLLQIDTAAGQHTDAQNVLDLLLKHQLVVWGQDKGVWVLDQSVRALALLYLRKERPDVLRKLHQQAYDMYAVWANKYKTLDYQQQAARFARELEGQSSATHQPSPHAPATHT